jgi:organic radical activating enzyme
VVEDQEEGQMAEYYPKTGVCYEHAEASKVYLIYNFGCNAACDHCLVESSPAKRAKLDPATAVEMLRQGAAYGKSFLTMSGGEMMIFPREVTEVAGAARDLGYYVCLNTNAFWARSPERARSVVADLKAAGVRAIFPTASAYHLRYVPVERVGFLREACQEQDVVCEINFFDSTDPELDRRIKDQLDLDSEVYFFDGLTTSGNNSETMRQLETIYRRRVPDDIDDCLSVHMGVNPHGHVVTTCNMTYDNARYRGTPFFLGNFKEQPFEEILQAERDSVVLQFLYHNPHPALHHILRDDPEVGERYRTIFSQRTYFTIIDFYVDLFHDQVMMDRINDRLASLTPA